MAVRPPPKAHFGQIPPASEPKVFVRIAFGKYRDQPRINEKQSESSWNDRVTQANTALKGGDVRIRCGRFDAS